MCTYMLCVCAHQREQVRVIVVAKHMDVAEAIAVVGVWICAQ